MLDISAGVEPQRTDNPQKAFELVRTRGAAILTGAGQSRDDARGVAERVLSSLSPVIPDPAPIKEGGGNKDQFYQMSGAELSSTRITFQTGHTDGFAYGDLLPDFIFLLCLRPASSGGESLSVDTYRILDALAASSDPDDDELLAFLTNEPIEQTEPGFQSSLAPIVVLTSSGRRMVRLTAVQRPDPNLPVAEQEKQKEFIARWAALTHASSVSGPKFVLQPGEALCLDNYRMLHGRTGFDDLERTLWRIWAWSREAIGVPDGMLFSDSRFATAK
jgi:hypothetical protein